MSRRLQRILVIDDDDEFRRSICVELEFHGYSVLESADASTGIRSALASHPDAIVCDDRLPDMPGLEVLKALQGDPLFAGVPFVLMMNYYDGNRASITLDEGAADVIARPFKMADLVARLRRALRPPPRLTSSVFKGQLKFVSLPDVLIMTSQNVQTGSLLVRNESKVFTFLFHGGRVVGVRGHKSRGLKAFFRALRVKDGEFKFTPWEGFSERPWHDPINVNAVLLTGTQELDELPLLLKDLPKERIFLTPKAKRNTLERGSVAYPLLSGPCTVEALLDQCDTPDLDAAKVLKQMFAKGEVEGE